MSQALTHPAQGTGKSRSGTGLSDWEKKEKSVFVRTRQNKKGKLNYSDCAAPCLSPPIPQEPPPFSPYVVVTLDKDVDLWEGKQTGLSMAFGKMPCPSLALGMAWLPVRRKGWESLELPK